MRLLVDAPGSTVDNPRMDELIVDVAESTFAEEVLDRSQTVPVLVDFWAEWCEPCRQLGPIIEKVVTDYGGAVVLAKVDADNAPRITMALGVQALPTVLLFVNGQAVDGFQGVQSAPAIKEILRRNGVEPRPNTPGTGATTAAPAALPDSEEGLSALLAKEPANAAALLTLARLQAMRGATDEALATIEQLPAGHSETRAAERLRDALEFWSGAAPGGEHEPSPALDARFEQAREAARSGRPEEALAVLYDTLAEDREYREGLARRAMVSLFGVVGETSETTKRYQKRLANLLY